MRLSAWRLSPLSRKSSDSTLKPPAVVVMSKPRALFWFRPEHQANFFSPELRERLSASVVMAQAFGVPAFPVDTHIHRLAQKWTLSSGRNVVQTERDLKRLFPREKWNKLHLQIIFYGREYSPARGVKAATDPITAQLFTKTA